MRFRLAGQPNERSLQVLHPIGPASRRSRRGGILWAATSAVDRGSAIHKASSLQQFDLAKDRQGILLVWGQTRKMGASPTVYDGDFV